MALSSACRLLCALQYSERPEEGLRVERWLIRVELVEAMAEDRSW